MTLQEFITRFDSVKKVGKGYMVRCPAHDDRTPSLSVTSRDGRILLNCFSGCDNDSIPAALGLTYSDLFEDHTRWLGNFGPSRPRPMTAAQIEERIVFSEVIPTPLPNTLKPVPILEPDLIPSPLRTWITDISERMQCPIELPAVAALVALGAVIGNSVVTKPKARDPWIVVPNLWGAVVGEPGAMKTPAVTEAMRFVREIERREAAAFDALRSQHAFERESREAEKKAIRLQLDSTYNSGKKQRKNSDVDGTIVDLDIMRTRFRELEEAVDPKPKRLTTSDATVEKLGELLNENPRGLLYVRDELSGFIELLDKPGREGDRAFYLETWNGLGSYNIDRIGRGSIRINNLTLSMFGTIQPSIVAPHFKSSGPKSVGDGFIQRFQAIVYPDLSRRFEYVDRDPSGMDEAKQVFDGIYDLDLSNFDKLTEDSGGYRFVKFDSEAQEFFREWLVELEHYLRNEGSNNPMLCEHIAKFRGLMPALALIFHLIECSVGRISKSIRQEQSELAAAWCSFFQAHAERLYDIPTQIGLTAAREILKRVNSGELSEELTARNIYRNKWSRLTEPADVKEGLEVLVDYGYLFETTMSTGGKPKTVYEVNGNWRKVLK